MCLARLRIGYSYSIDNIPSQISEMASGIITLHTDIPLDGFWWQLFGLVFSAMFLHQYGNRSSYQTPMASSIIRSEQHGLQIGGSKSADPEIPGFGSCDPCSGSVGSLLLLLLDLATGFNRPSLTNRKAPNSVWPGNLVYTEKPKTIGASRRVERMEIRRALMLKPKCSN